MYDQHFKRRSDLTSFLIVAGHMIMVFGPIYFVAITGLSYYVIAAWLIFGLGMNGIINLMHECAHYLVFRKKWGSKFLGKYIIAPMVFTNFDIYRKRHWAHHKHLGVEGETKDTYLINIRGKHIFLLFLRCLVCIEAFKKFTKQLHSIIDDELFVHDQGWSLRTLVFQVIFFASLYLSAYYIGEAGVKTALIHALIAYLGVYVYGVMSLTVFIADLRAIAEHQIYPSNDAREGHAALRNFKCNALTRVIMGAYGFSDHFTHHKIPGIPYYSLKKATEDLSKKDEHLAPKKGYFQTISEIIKSTS